MAKKTRVYELARELGKESKEILDLLADSGVRDKNHMSALEDNVVRFIKNRLAKKEGKQPEASAEVSQPPSAEPRPREAPKPREKPKPTPMPLPIPRSGQAGPTRPGLNHRRPYTGAAPGQIPRRPAGQRPGGDARVGAGGFQMRDRDRERWDPRRPQGAGPRPSQPAQRPYAGRHWPTQVAPPVPQGRALGARPGRPQVPTSQGAAPQQRPIAPRPTAGEPATQHADRRPAVLQRPRQVRPAVVPARPEPAPRPVHEAPHEVEAPPRPRPTVEVVQPSAPVVAEPGPAAPVSTPPARVTGAEAASAQAPPVPPAAEETAGRAEERATQRRAAEQRPQAAVEKPVAPRPKEEVASGGAAAERERPAREAQRPRPEQRPARERRAQAPATSGGPEGKRPAPAGPRRERKGERAGRPEQPVERRLELIKGGKGAAKLRESRAEAIIRSRMPRRAPTAQPAAALPRRRERPKRDMRIALPPTITVGELAQRLGVNSGDVIKSLMGMGLLVTINQEIDFDAASLVADEYGFDAEPLEQKEAREFGIEDVPDAAEELVPRPPVVTVLGHVDHGKTSLLDAIRETNVTAQEAGGITQHIGAYQVELGGRRITFIDTPGHEAFTAMRARGAQVTDIAVLVVAADDGVMPQTEEAINHARAAKVPIVVAINKIDKAGAQPDRVKQQLSDRGLVPEQWGGDTVMVEVSALRRQGIEDLLEMILLVADMRDLKANPNRAAKGTVIEARLDRGRGPVATVLVEKGTLRVGDAIVAGEVSGKVRAMADDQGRPVQAAGPSMPVEVLGFSDVPQAGDVLQVVPEDKLAKQLATRRSERKRAEEVQAPRTVSLEALFGKIKEGEIKELNLILKADVQGSVEALRQSLENLSTDEVKVNVIHAGVGAISKNDVMLASASNAIIIGFQVRPDANARQVAERDRVDIRLYKIIYDATDDVRAAMQGLLEPEVREVILGRADVTATFRIPKVGVVAGCSVSEGKITRDAQARVLRDNVVVHEGRIGSLRRFKEDVSEVSAGYECGIGLAGFQDIKEGDVIEAFKMEETPREL